MFKITLTLPLTAAFRSPAKLLLTRKSGQHPGTRKQLKGSRLANGNLLSAGASVSRNPRWASFLTTS